MMIDPINGLGDPEERYLGKGIEAKILIEEVEQTNLQKDTRTPLGLRMFNYKLIDLDNVDVVEEIDPDAQDIDKIKNMVGYKHLKDTKDLPLTASQEHFKKEKLAKRIFEPTLKIKQQIVSKRPSIEESKPPKSPRLKMPSFHEMDQEEASQKHLGQLLSELATKPEDQPKINRFIDFYFNELVYKELVETEKTMKKNQTKAFSSLEDDKKSDYLANYMKFLREHAHINYTTYGCKANQLDGNVLGKKEMDLYPCKIKTTNHIE